MGNCALSSLRAVSCVGAAAAPHPISQRNNVFNRMHVCTDRECNERTARSAPAEMIIIVVISIMAQETIIERIMLMQRSRRKRPRAELGGTALCLTRRRRSNCDLKKSPLQETIAPKNQLLIHGDQAFLADNFLAGDFFDISIVYRKSYYAFLGGGAQRASYARQLNQSRTHCVVAKTVIESPQLVEW